MIPSVVDAQAPARRSPARSPTIRGPRSTRTGRSRRVSSRSQRAGQAEVVARRAVAGSTSRTGRGSLARGVHDPHRRSETIGTYAESREVAIRRTSAGASSSRVATFRPIPIRSRGPVRGLDPLGEDAAELAAARPRRRWASGSRAIRRGIDRRDRVDHGDGRGQGEPAARARSASPCAAGSMPIVNVRLPASDHQVCSPRPRPRVCRSAQTSTGQVDRGRRRPAAWPGRWSIRRPPRASRSGRSGQFMIDVGEPGRDPSITGLGHS